MSLLSIALVCLAQSLPDGPGKEIVEIICNSCHSVTRVTEKHWTRAEWKLKVLEMLQEETDVTPADQDAIVDYLARNFPKKVNANRAASKDLEHVLELAAKDAEAIVHYREEKGVFKTLDDLKKVPGIDAAKIEAMKERLEF
jgi:competence protein ComEA